MKFSLTLLDVGLIYFGLLAKKNWQDFQNCNPIAHMNDSRIFFPKLYFFSSLQEHEQKTNKVWPKKFGKLVKTAFGVSRGKIEGFLEKNTFPSFIFGPYRRIFIKVLADKLLNFC